MDQPPDFSDRPESLTKGNHQYEVIALAPWTAVLLCLEVLMDVSGAALKAVLCKRNAVLERGAHCEDSCVGVTALKALPRCKAWCLESP